MIQVFLFVQTGWQNSQQWILTNYFSKTVHTQLQYSISSDPNTAVDECVIYAHTHLFISLFSSEI